MLDTSSIYTRVNGDDSLVTYEDRIYIIESTTASDYN
jgi:hypothetical protein